jgi:hypothetical protein
MSDITNIKLNNISKNPSIASMLIQKPSSFNLSGKIAMARPVQPYFVPTATKRVTDRIAPNDSAKRSFDSSRTLAGMLLAAVVAALLVVADQLIDTWADGHLLVVWVALWTVAFAALALLAPPLRLLADSAAGTLARWSRARAKRRSDEVMWRVAQQDYRVMQDLQMAGLRSERDA